MGRVLVHPPPRVMKRNCDRAINKCKFLKNVKKFLHFKIKFFKNVLDLLSTYNVKFIGPVGNANIPHGFCSHISYVLFQKFKYP